METGSGLVSTTWSRVPLSSSRGLRASIRDCTHGVQKNCRKVIGSSISMNRVPLSSTSMLKARPRSVWKVMSPKPRVDITVRVQYNPVNQV